MPRRKQTKTRAPRQVRAPQYVTITKVYELDKACVAGDHRSIGAVFCIKLTAQRFHMQLDGWLLQVQINSYLFV